MTDDLTPESMAAEQRAAAFLRKPQHTAKAGKPELVEDDVADADIADNLSGPPDWHKQGKDAPKGWHKAGDTFELDE